MACDLTHGRGIPCRNLIGGVKYVYFGNKDQFTITSAGSDVTDIELTSPSTDKLYRYSVRRGNASVTETITGSTENGTVVYAPTVNVKLTGLSTQDQNELKLLAQADLIIFVQLNQVLSTNDHNVILCLGATNGMDLNAGTNASGAAFADLNGYDWTFEGQEFAPMLTVADYSTVPFDNTAFNGGTPIPVVTT
tara:strand:- start:600 stop:1178 length:579 start_codon:yes stop_codon:yes gene_type:complete